MKTITTMLVGLALCIPAFGQMMNSPSDVAESGLLSVFDAKWSDFAPASIRIDCNRKANQCRETRAIYGLDGVIRLPSYLFAIRSWSNTTVTADDGEVQTLIINFKDRTAMLLFKVQREGEKKPRTETHELVSTIPLVKR